jgi:hypothetical protein
LVLACAGASAQKSLVVYHVTGRANLLAGNTISVAKRGNLIAKNNSLQLDKNSDCMLIDDKGRSVQVNTAGVFTFEALQKMMADAGKTGVTQKFFSYVYENLFSSKKNDQLAITPVVFRGEKRMKNPSDYTIIISDAATLSWKKSAGSTTVHMVIKDIGGNRFMDTLIKKSKSLQLNLAEGNFLPGAVYEWKVEEAGSRSPKENYFHFLLAKTADTTGYFSEVGIGVCR